MRPVHFLVLIIVLLLLFGASKLPDLARSIGQSAKILRNELKDVPEAEDPAPTRRTVPEEEPPSAPTGQP